MYVEGTEQIYECGGDDIILDTTFTWEGIITYQTTSLDIELRLMDTDSWPGENDIADISAYVGGGPDDTNTFPRGAVFKRTYDLVMNDWYPVDDDNDYLQCEYDPQSMLYWYVTSGNFDGSTTTDENDATVWFDIAVENRPPIPPTTPYGPDKGEVYIDYEYSTQSMDPDGDLIQYGWDWDGDYVIDELTSFYEGWETVQVTHSWGDTGVYYVHVVAIDVHGMIGGWSNPLVVEINGPGGISGFKVEEWSLGHVYTLYMDHEDTQNLLWTIENAQDVITAVAGLIVVIAAACGVPLDITVATGIAIAIVQVGVAVIRMLDQGMGVYFRAYTIEVSGVIIFCVAYIWSQTLGGGGGEDNHAPEMPIEPYGPVNGRAGKEYTYSSTTTDIDTDNMFYVFDWGDGTYNFSEWHESGETVSMSHRWSERGSYSIRVKAVDNFGAESEWSDPLSITMPKSSFSHSSLLLRLFERFPHLFPVLRFLLCS